MGSNMNFSFRYLTNIVIVGLVIFFLFCILNPSLNPLHNYEYFPDPTARLRKKKKNEESKLPNIEKTLNKLYTQEEDLKKKENAARNVVVEANNEIKRAKQELTAAKRNLNSI